MSDTRTWMGSSRLKSITEKMKTLLRRTEDRSHPQNHLSAGATRSESFKTAVGSF